MEENVNPTLPSSPPVIIKPKRPKSFWVALILGILLFFSALLNFFLFLLLVIKLIPTPTNLYEERSIEGEADAPAKILRVSVEGIIMSETTPGLFGRRADVVQTVIDSLKLAAADRTVKGVILSVNSPGGGVTACDRIHAALRRLKEERPDIKVVAYMSEMATSGGYYISAASDHIVAQPTTLTGSIGVIASFLNVTELFKNIGVSTEVIKSADKKDIGSPFRRMTDQERGILQDIINEMYQRFVNVVAEGRPKLNRPEILRLADGRVYTGEQALKNGLVDELGDEEDAIAAIKKLAGLTNTHIIEYKKPAGFWELFGTRGTGFNPSTGWETTLKQILLESKTPRICYLWTME